jgi:hypothetical protein
MSNALIRFSMVALLLAGCAHRGAVRVVCDGPLSPINAPVQAKEAPVSVVPASPGTGPARGTQAP